MESHSTYKMVDGVEEFKLLGYLHKSETKQDNDERLACFCLVILHEQESWRDAKQCQQEYLAGLWSLWTSLDPISSPRL